LGLQDSRWLAEVVMHDVIANEILVVLAHDVYDQQQSTFLQPPRGPSEELGFLFLRQVAKPR
jgi:hypothetical protein